MLIKFLKILVQELCSCGKALLVYLSSSDTHILSHLSKQHGVWESFLAALTTKEFKRNAIDGCQDNKLFNLICRVLGVLVTTRHGGS